MNEFIQEPVVFLNETDSSYDVGAGIIFRKSGVYDVTITGNKTIVSKVSDRKRGKWLLSIQRDGFEGSECSQCGYHIFNTPLYGYNYCPNCGADMIGGERSEEE